MRNFPDLAQKVEHMEKKKTTRVRITVTLDEDVYRKIKRIGRLMGLLPATWVGMVATSKANSLEITTDSRQGE